MKTEIITGYDGKKAFFREYDRENPLDMLRLVARERCAWPGGYELCAITNDGALICSECCRENFYGMVDSTKKEIDDGWQVVGFTNESELEKECCSHCNKKLGYWED